MHTPRSLFAVAIFIALLFGAGLSGPIGAAPQTAKPEDVGLSSERLKRITDLINRHITANNISGAVTLVARNGRVAHFEAEGVMDLASKKPMQKDTIFRIYSMTKPITGVAMMILFEEGKWQLNDPVSKYIPEFANLKVGKPNPATGTVTPVAPDHPMTMRELMSHSVGLTYGLFGSTAVDKMYTDANVLDAKQPMQAMIDKLRQAQVEAELRCF